MMNPSPTSAEQIGRLLDHAILHPTTTPDQAMKELNSIASLPLATVCIKPSYIPLAVKRLTGTRIGVGTVIGFPHGSATSAAKADEAKLALDDGANELDMVVNVGWALGEQWRDIERDISAVLKPARERKAILKVIFETDYLPQDATKIRLCEICGQLNVDFVKTSTGFGFVKGNDGKFSSLLFIIINFKYKLINI